jgi:short subunit dehydrogenase-like uncharacterized protein
MIYGANGYTGRLVLAEAVRRGEKPIVAGRNSAEVAVLAREHGLPARTFDLRDPKTVASALNGVGLVLHCAGPFSQTSAPMLEGCLAVGAHYLDITGEIDVFAHAFAQHARAVERKIVVLPGSGFDVVPTDCVAATLKQKLPDATELVLAFEAGGGPSPGTARTSVEGLGKGGRVRRDGELVRVPLAYKTRTFDRDGQPRSAMTIPWGDVFTAWVSTGIGNIETYMAVPPATIANVQRLNWVRPLLGLGPVRRFMQARVQASVRGPDESRRASSGCRVWGEARNAAGREAKLEIDTPNGYDLTVTASLGIVDRILHGKPKPAGGYRTPSQLMGADYVLTLPGVREVGA